MLVCFDVSPELPNNSPKVAICLFTSEPAIEEVKFEVFFSSVADTTMFKAFRCARNERP